MDQKKQKNHKLEKIHNGKKNKTKDRLEDCVHWVSLPNRIRGVCTISRNQWDSLKDCPYCYRRCDRNYSPSRQTYKTLKGGYEHGRK